MIKRSGNGNEVNNEGHREVSHELAQMGVLVRKLQKPKTHEKRKTPGSRLAAELARSGSLAEADAVSAQFRSAGVADSSDG